MRLEIAVTWGDIETGIRDSSLFCPVALAIRRATGAGQVSVNENKIRLRLGGGPPIHFDTPNEIMEFINAFDSGEKVEPFGFNLDDSAGGIPNGPPEARPAPTPARRPRRKEVDPMAQSLAITHVYGTLTLDQYAETPDHPRETFTIRSFEVTEDGEETIFVFRLMDHTGRESTVIATLPVPIRIRSSESGRHP